MDVAQKLKEFQQTQKIVNVGALGTALMVTRKFRAANLNLDGNTATSALKAPEAILTKGGGQVAGLSGGAINKVLAEYGLAEQVGTESGRTSRGTPALAEAYAQFLTELSLCGDVDLIVVEAWWVERFKEYFNSEPFKLSYDESKTLVSALRSLIDQAIARQKRMPGKTFVGTVLQHLVGAKLSLAMPNLQIKHNGASVADAVSARSGDFVLDDVVIHCTTTPSPELLKKCMLNLDSGVRPLILTLAKSVGAAEQAAEDLGIEGRVEVMDALQFVAANLYEMSDFKNASRKTVVTRLIETYNEIVALHEHDRSLRVQMG
jgi:Domain of unknown function (DUF4928)